MAFSESDYTQIRKYMGYSFKTSTEWPNINSLIKESQSIADGGIAPDDSQELEIKAIVLELQGIDANLAQFRQASMSVLVDGKIHNDFVRGMQSLRMEGRRLVGRLCTMLTFNAPKFDMFSSRIPDYF